MTLTDVAPSRTDQVTGLATVLANLGEAIAADGIGAHEQPVHRLAAAARLLAPGAAHSLADTTLPTAPREHAFDVVVRVTLRCADVQTREMLAFALRV